jgi:uncharacterized cysteine cluster protein YcgN (CxxCxxCC family)
MVTSGGGSRRERWESLCKRCGICCYEKDAGFFRTVIHLSKPCEYFDKKTNLCTVYNTRFKTCRWCAKVSLWHALFSRCLPDTCGYVEHYAKWRLVRGAEIEK